MIATCVCTVPASFTSWMPAVNVPLPSEVNRPASVKARAKPSAPLSPKANDPSSAAFVNAVVSSRSMLPLAVALVSKRATSARALDTMTKRSVMGLIADIRVSVPRPSAAIEYVPVAVRFGIATPAPLMSKTPEVRLPFPSARKLPRMANGPDVFTPDALKTYAPFRLELVNPPVGAGASWMVPPPEPPPQPIAMASATRAARLSARVMPFIGTLTQPLGCKMFAPLRTLFGL